MKRRTFLRNAALVASAGVTARPARALKSPYSWKPEDEDYRDPETGAYLRCMTPGIAHAECVYQTHPMWTRAMRYFLFHVLEDGGHVPYARQVASGIARPLTDGNIGASVLDGVNDVLYYMRGREIFRQPVETTFQRLRPALRLSELPRYAARLSGGISLDADGMTLYVGVRLDEDDQWAVLIFDLRSNLWRRRVETDFQIGHVQAHPDINGLVMFCHETGGDAPQRMWRFLDADVDAVPYFPERGEEWVTHEVWWNNRALYTIWPYDEERLNYQYGIVSVGLQTGSRTWHCKYKAWHTHGSPDGQWILGDDFDRNLWMIAPQGGERRLLSQGHTTGDFGTHPHASFTPDSRAVVTNSSILGREAVLVVECPRWSELSAR